MLCLHHELFLVFPGEIPHNKDYTSDSYDGSGSATVAGSRYASLT